MREIQKQFHDFIKDKQLVKNDEKVLLAVSGGVDSMVMADLFFKSEIQFGIAHCNFGLRGAESDGDEAFVRDWAEKRKIHFHSKRFDLGKRSIQVEARKVRYKWFYELVEKHAYQKIATAHHRNDSLETFLINLSRGTGIRGLTGIQVAIGKIIRPLLFANRTDIEAYAKAVLLSWREDASNQKLDYDRNVIRHRIVPELAKINPSLLSTFETTTERLQAANELLQGRVQEVRDLYLSEDQGLLKVRLGWVRSPEDRLVLGELLSDFGFNYVVSREVFEAKGSSGKRFFSTYWEAVTDRGQLFLKKRVDIASDELEIVGEGTFGFGEKTVRIERVASREVVFGDPHIAFFDVNQLTFPLKIRAWKEGDRFQPFGMKGTKKVSDFLIDEKVPLALKDQVCILISGDRIAWVVGYRTAEGFKVDNERNGEVLRLVVDG